MSQVPIKKMLDIANVYRGEYFGFLGDLSGGFIFSVFYFTNKNVFKSKSTNNKLPFISDFRASLFFVLFDLTNF